MAKNSKLFQATNSVFTITDESVFQLGHLPIEDFLNIYPMDIFEDENNY